ncbi:hypothetical protein ABZ883_24630 [Streptomyces sp. NPDC046977]|uniref:hypothetical protein n=1 Tax=Streptomyces sp. NPDC046977 TaxID=3154703 RepID=UPI0033ED9E78
MADDIGPLYEPGVAHVRITAADAATAHRVADLIASRFPGTRPASVTTAADGLVEFVLFTHTLESSPTHPYDD